MRLTLIILTIICAALAIITGIGSLAQAYRGGVCEAKGDYDGSRDARARAALGMAVSLMCAYTAGLLTWAAVDA